MSVLIKCIIFIMGFSHDLGGTRLSNLVGKIIMFPIFLIWWPFPIYHFCNARFKHWEFYRFIKCLESNNLIKGETILKKLSHKKLSKLWKRFYEEQEAFLVYIQSREMIDIMTRYGFNLNHTEKRSGNIRVFQLKPGPISWDMELILGDNYSETNFFLSSRHEAYWWRDQASDPMPYKGVSKTPFFFIEAYKNDLEQLKIFQQQSQEHFALTQNYEEISSYLKTLIERLEFQEVIVESVMPQNKPKYKLIKI